MTPSVLATEQHPLLHLGPEDGLLFVDQADAGVTVDVVHLLLTVRVLIVRPVAVLLLVVLKIHHTVEQSLTSVAPG